MHAPRPPGRADFVSENVHGWRLSNTGNPVKKKTAHASSDPTTRAWGKWLRFSTADGSVGNRSHGPNHGVAAPAYRGRFAIRHKAGSGRCGIPCAQAPPSGDGASMGPHPPLSISVLSASHQRFKTGCRSAGHPRTRGHCPRLQREPRRRRSGALPQSTSRSLGFMTLQPPFSSLISRSIECLRAIFLIFRRMSPLFFGGISWTEN